MRSPAERSTEREWIRGECRKEVEGEDEGAEENDKQDKDTESRGKCVISKINKVWKLSFVFSVLYTLTCLIFSSCSSSSRKKVKYMNETSTSGFPPCFLCSSTVSFPPENACLLICEQWFHRSDQTVSNYRQYKSDQ